MRLKSVWISEYKNLKDFKQNFDGQCFMDIFVGKNGTGKSNFFEALIEIFRHLYEYGTRSLELEGVLFDYSIQYEIGTDIIQIEWKEKQLLIKINSKPETNLSKTPLPDNVLIYYSGHNPQITALVRRYEDAFKKAIKKADIQDTRRFIGIGREYKQLLLAMLLIQDESNKAKQYICQKLGIKTVGQEVKVILQRPFYARYDGYDVDIFDDKTLYWRPQGITRDFLHKLARCKANEPKERIREEGYFQRDEKYADEFILYFDLAKLRKEFAENGLPTLFRQFDNLKTIEMLKEISIEIELENGMRATTDCFSDGQVQSVYIYSLIELFKDRNCITLLDEPDAFLHPEWQHDFLTQVGEISIQDASKNHVLMSSHSPVTLIPFRNSKIRFFDLQEFTANCYPVPKRIAVSKLSDAIIQYSERDTILSIINTIQIGKRPVLFTEGFTDPVILKEAWYKLYEDEIPFIPFYAFSCNFLSQLLRDQKVIAEMEGRPLFGLFDFDEAYNQWNGIDGEIIKGNPYEGLIKKRNGFEVYGMMLPVPQNERIRRQVIRDPETLTTYCHESRCEIEHIFFGSGKTEGYYKEEPCVGGSRIIFASDAKKTHFAEIIVPTVEKDYFEAFRPMFEFIREKCSS